MPFRKFIAALLTLIPFAAYAELEIKGIQVDKPADCEYIRSLETRTGNYFKACESKGKRWMTKVSFLDKPTPLWVYQTPEGVVSRVIVNEIDFDKTLNSLEAKYGKPQLEESVIQNRMGATFDQLTARWVSGKSYLILKKHSSKIGEPILMLLGEEAVKSVDESKSPSSDI